MLSCILKYACYACIVAMSLGGIPHKVPTGVHVLTIRTCWTDQNMMQLLTYRHRSRHAQKANRWREIRSKIRTVHQKMPAAPARAHGAQNRDRSAENALKMRTVGQKFSPREHREHENGDRSSEKRQKRRPLEQKRALEGNATRPAVGHRSVSP